MYMVDLKTEREIIEQAQLDPSCFAVIFDAHYPMILGYTLKRVANPVVAQDITAETFYKALTNIHKFKWQGISIIHWLYKIATNELRIYFRKSKSLPHSLENMFEQVGFDPIDKQNLAEEIIEIQTHLERHQEYLCAQKLLLTLPVKCQEVIALRFVENKKLSEIASILNKKEGTVKSLLSRGLRLLRRRMETHEVQPLGGKRIVVRAKVSAIKSNEVGGII